MRRWFATSNASTTPTGLRSAVEKLCERVGASQNSSTGYLLEIVKSLIDKYPSTLAKKFNIQQDKNEISIKEEIWQKLISLEGVDSIRSERRSILNMKNSQYRVPQISYNNFLKALYPQKNRGSLGLRLIEKDLSNYINNAIKYELINHDLVYRCYCELSEPATLYMKPNHLEDFISRFLYRRDFIKPNPFSSSYTRSASIMYTKYIEMLDERAAHVGMCTKILNDMKVSGLPLSTDEQNQLIFMTFFRDRADVIEKINKTVRRLTEEGMLCDVHKLRDMNRFDWDTYQLIKSLFSSAEYLPLGIDTYNTLLFIAIRHERHDIIRDILKNLGMLDLIQNFDPSQANITTISNRETVELLIDYFSSASFRKNSKDETFTAFQNIITYLSNSQYITPDIRTINKIIRGLTSMKAIEDAEILVSKLFINPQSEDTEEGSLGEQTPDLTLYMNLTFEDKMFYKKLLKLYDQLKQILKSQNPNINIDSYKLIANEGTFRPLIYSYCSPNNDENSFRKAAYMMQIMEEQYGLPITSRLFHALFQKFIDSNKQTVSYNSDWNLKQLNQVIIKLINSHDTYSSNQDTLLKTKVDRMVLSPQLKSFVNNHLERKSSGDIPNDRGNFVKLSDGLIYLVHQACVAVLSNDHDMDLTQKKTLLGLVDSYREDLLSDIKDIRSSTSPFTYRARKQMVYKNDEITYIKKEFLVNLIDSTYPI